VLVDDEGRASDSATEGNTEALVLTFRSSAHWRLYPFAQAGAEVVGETVRESRQLMWA
jgi:hypothetical protein